ncbi:MAG: class II glutamine amidotransferase [Candidatus Bathyarchaeia archaeon]
MCGIAGVYGYKAVLKAMTITLAQLERGTQGSGIAYIKGGLRVLKEPIHPVRFFNKHIRLIRNCTARAAIAHNRMPSMGSVSYYNTHPFMDCRRRFALAHNGSTVFAKEVKDKILLGHNVKGETDSEILTHLLEERLDEFGDLVSALLSLANSDLSGAVLVLDRRGRIYGARLGFEPLHYALEGGEVYLASSAMAIRAVLRGSAPVRALGRGQVIEVCRGKANVYGEAKEEPRVTGYYYYSKYYNKYGWWSDYGLD